MNHKQKRGFVIVLGSLAILFAIYLALLTLYRWEQASKLLMESERLAVVFDDLTAFIDIPSNTQIESNKYTLKHLDYNFYTFSLAADGREDYIIFRPVSNTSSDMEVVVNPANLVGGEDSLGACLVQFGGADAGCGRSIELGNSRYCSFEGSSSAAAIGSIESGLIGSYFTKSGPTFYVGKHREFDDLCFSIRFNDDLLPHKKIAAKFFGSLGVSTDMFEEVTPEEHEFRLTADLRNAPAGSVDSSNVLVMDALTGIPYVGTSLLHESKPVLSSLPSNEMCHRYRELSYPNIQCTCGGSITCLLKMYSLRLLDEFFKGLGELSRIS